MKPSALILLVLLAGASAAPVDIVRDFLIGLREQMPCGFPEYGLPALAPLLLDTFKLDNPGLFLKVDELRLAGLNSFEIETMTLNVLIFKMGFGFNFEKIHLKTKYATDIEFGTFDLEGITGLPKIFGEGAIDFALHNLTLDGNLQLQFHDGGNSSSLKDFKVNLGVDDVELKITGLLDSEIVSDFFGDVLISVIKTFTTDPSMRNFVSETLHSLIVPLANSLLVDLNLSTILGWINGSGGIGEPKPPCLPLDKTAFMYGGK